MKLYKLVLPLLWIVLFAGCRDDAAVEELEAIHEQQAVEMQNAELVTRWYREIDSGNIDGILEFFHEDLQWYTPSNSSNPRTMETVRGVFERAFLSDAQWTHQLQEVVPTADRVIIRSIDSAKHEGEFLGIPASGSEVKYGAIMIFRIQEGKIIEIREEADYLQLYIDLGWEL